MSQAELDWTIEDIPPEEPGGAQLPPEAPERRPAGLRFWRQWRFWAAAAVGLALAGAGVFAFYRAGWQRVQAQIEREVAYEDEQSRAGNAAAVRAVQAESQAPWADRRAAEAALGWPATLPAEHLLPTGQPARVSNVRALDGGLVEATVVRAFADSAGNVFEFDYLQRYTSPQPGLWQRLPPVASPATSLWTGQRLSVTLPAGEAAWLLPLLAQVDDTLVRACGHWNCRALTTVDVVLVDDVGQLAPPVPLTTAGVPEAYPVVFSLPLVNRPQWHLPLRLPGPALAGRPHDAAAAGALVRGYAGQSLAQMAMRLARRARSSDQVYLDALIAREEIRLGISPAPAWAVSLRDYVPPEQLWHAERASIPPILARPSPARALQALAFLDFALAGMSAQHEASLLTTLWAAQLSNWLDQRVPGRGDDLLAAWRAHVWDQLAAEAPTDWAALDGLAYACREDLYVVGPAGPARVPVAGVPLFLSPNARSPDGRYLALLMISNDQLHLQLVPPAGGRSIAVAQEAFPAGWTSTGQLLYLRWAGSPTPTGTADELSGFDAYLFNPATGLHRRVSAETVLVESLADFMAWSASHAHFAVTLLKKADPASPYTVPAVIGFEPQVTLVEAAQPGYASAISPDGRWLAYWEGTSSRFATAQLPRLSLLDLESGKVRSLLPAPEWPGLDSAAGSSPIWTADGRRLAFTYWDGNQDPRLLVATFAGQDPGAGSIERASYTLAAPNRVYYHFVSASGRYVVVGGGAEAGQSLSSQQLAVLDLETGITQPPLTSADLGLGPAWSPTGQRLAVPGPAGLYVVDVATGEIQWVAPGECVAAWYPPAR